MVKIKNIWNHHLDNLNQFHLDFLIPPQKNKDETTAWNDCQTVHHADVSVVAFDSNFDSHGLQKSETSKMDKVFCGWSPRQNPLKSICSKTSQKLVTKIIKKKLQTRGHAACSYSETTRLDPPWIQTATVLCINSRHDSVSSLPTLKQQVVQRIHIPSENGKKTECTVAFFHDSSDGLVLNRCSSIDNL